MKSIKIILAILFLSASTNSCDEGLLNEVPKDFLSPENAYVMPAQFESAVTELHKYLRNFLYPTDGSTYFALYKGTDQAFNPETITTGAFADYSKYNSSNWYYGYYWGELYTWINRSNTIISRASSPQAQFTSEQEREMYIAQGKFFRAYAYRFLGHLYGGVPIIREEITAPKLDFVRSTRDEVYQFCKEDLEYASQKLPRKADGSGGVTAAVADHLLSEILISLKDWEGAIAASTRVIDDPQYQLMKERFGSKKDQPGDVFWDLFRRENINRKDGNLETIFALQFKYNVPGGSAKDVTWMGYNGERGWGPRYWLLKDPDGKAGTEAVDSLGRGASWCRPTYYAHTIVWKNSDWNDMRNSRYNIKREFYYNLKSSAYFGKKITELHDQADTMMCYYPYIMKVTDYPHEGNFMQAQVFRPIALMRVSETYLLRAEAYLGKGNKAEAAADINQVRSRAKAKPVLPEQVDIDYILDERTRELMTEEYRQVTLCRLGKLYERTQKYGLALSAQTVSQKNNLWAIPQNQIDLNSGVKMENNPGF